MGLQATLNFFFLNISLTECQSNNFHNYPVQMNLHFFFQVDFILIYRLCCFIFRCYHLLLENSWASETKGINALKWQIKILKSFLDNAWLNYLFTFLLLFLLRFPAVLIQKGWIVGADRPKIYNWPYLLLIYHFGCQVVTVSCSG